MTSSQGATTGLRPPPGRGWLAVELSFVLVLSLLASVGIIAGLWISQCVRTVAGFKTRESIGNAWRHRVQQWRFLERPTRRTIGITLAATLAAMAVTLVIASLPSAGPDGAYIDEFTERIRGDHGLVKQAGSIFILTVLGPTLEELAFRLYAIRGIQELAAGTRLQHVATPLALVVSTLMFATIHYSYDVLSKTDVALCGLIYATAFLKTNNIFAAIVAHGMTNALFVIAVLST